jgi:hypothetical protein
MANWRKPHFTTNLYHDKLVNQYLFQIYGKRQRLLKRNGLPFFQAATSHHWGRVLQFSQALGVFLLVPVATE